jgi:hypothetical protein
LTKKRIVLLLDGTWNDSDAGNRDTNIVRIREIMAQCLFAQSVSEGDATNPERNEITPAEIDKFATSTIRAVADGYKYVVFYERGVGTGGFLDAWKGGPFGAGLAENIRRAYLFLVANYEPGDEIFVFGFSRGSFTARSLAGLLSVVGLIKARDCTAASESKAWWLYKTSPPKRLPPDVHELRELSHPQIAIKCLSLFDTVGALGVPLPTFWRENRDLFGFHDVSLNSICEVNLHALAVDEHREPFEAAVWRQHKYKYTASSDKTEQVWFAGAHADVGGGYIAEPLRSRCHTAALDDISLDWMLRRVVFHCPDFPVRLQGNPAWTEIPFASAKCDPWINADQHEARRGLYRIFPTALRSLGNQPIKVSSYWRVKNVSYDRHESPVGEMLHISVIERLGRPVKVDNRRQIYAPLNVTSILSKLEGIYSSQSTTSQSTAFNEFRVVSWTGKPLSPTCARDSQIVRDCISRAKNRLRPQ